MLLIAKGTQGHRGTKGNALRKNIELLCKEILNSSGESSDE